MKPVLQACVETLGLLGGFGSYLVEIDARRLAVIQQHLARCAHHSSARMPGVNATCHGESAWS